MNRHKTFANVPLIEPLGSLNEIQIGRGFQTFFDYFNDSYRWVLEVAVGFVVIWVLIGGFMYMTSGTDQSTRSEAVSRMTWAIVGLMLLLFAGIVSAYS